MLLWTWLGCGSPCPFGPQCEDSRTGARVSALSGALMEEQPDAWVDANPLLLGSEEHGSDWAVTSIEGRIVIGMPEADLVVAPTGNLSGKVELAARDGFRVGAADFGTSISAGYVDKDGAWDLLVGGPAWNLSRGAVYLFLDAENVRGSIAGGDSVADLTFLGSSHSDQLGQEVRICGDLTGDGRADLAMTAPWFTQSDEAPFSDQPIPNLAGAVFVARSEEIQSADPGARLSPWALGPTWWGTDVGAGLGHALLCDRDIDGDGLSDLLIGAPWAGEDDAGATWIVLGGDLPGDGPIDTVADASILGGKADGWAGTAIALVDVDGDTFADPAIGVPGGTGLVQVYRGSDVLAADDADPVTTVLPEEDLSGAPHFGRWLASGDLDADGNDDLLVGAPDRVFGRNFDAGGVWGFKGARSWKGTFLAEDADFRVLGTQPFQRVGKRLHVADLDEDGLADVLLPTRSNPVD